MSQLLGAEPPHGDFVAYLQEIERRQLEDMRLAHQPTPPRTVMNSPATPASHSTTARGQSEGKRGTDRAHGTHGADSADSADRTHGTRGTRGTQDSAAAPYTPMNKGQAEALVEVLKTRARASGVAANAFAGGLIIAFVALAFFVGGASSGQVVPMLIGIGLAWFAFTRLRKAVRGDDGDLAQRLQRQHNRSG